MNVYISLQQRTMDFQSYVSWMGPKKNTDVQCGGIWFGPPGYVSINLLMPVTIHFPAQKEPSLENVGESPLGQTKLATSTITMRAWLVQTSWNHWEGLCLVLGAGGKHLPGCCLSGILTWLQFLQKFCGWCGCSRQVRFPEAIASCILGAENVVKKRARLDRQNTIHPPVHHFPQIPKPHCHRGYLGYLVLPIFPTPGSQLFSPVYLITSSSPRSAHSQSGPGFAKSK